MIVEFDPFGPALSPVALALTTGLVWLYIRGTSRPRLVRERVGAVRHALFTVGVVLLAIAFVGPLATAGPRLFAAHQVQHLMIRLLGPMLIVLAYPWPVLRAGLPYGIRHALGRFSDRPATRSAARILTRLDVSFVLLIAALYLWQVPALHNAAIAIQSLALLAHLSMALAGLNFFAVVLDRRDAPEGAIQSLRLLALVGVVVSNILLGSLTTMKETVLYTGYDIAGRLWDFTPLADETAGGYTIWVPSSFVIIAAIILVFNGWNAAEVRRWNARNDWTGSNAAALEFPETAHELRLKVADPNRRMGRTLALASAAMFATVMITAATIIYAL
ncbi:cytochrome c oxidase assembly protein [Rhodobacteraceae bacterium R_SAG3]|uniref:cytochrome c oxidase assembly protein n=1 Tax=Tritonibacter mobilis TaxID=379347 RepID=UPI000806F1BE|nr:cytochrome c oxidase assembly protein [Tritonibacter mobilis]NKX75737.1 cytochrome c oxidase assembly protein [Rhodobacteraceae bacterium R_SAG3]